MGLTYNEYAIRKWGEDSWNNLTRKKLELFKKQFESNQDYFNKDYESLLQNNTNESYNTNESSDSSLSLSSVSEKDTSLFNNSPIITNEDLTPEELEDLELMRRLNSQDSYNINNLRNSAYNQINLNNNLTKNEQRQIRSLLNSKQFSDSDAMKIILGEYNPDLKRTTTTKLIKTTRMASPERSKLLMHEAAERTHLEYVDLLTQNYKEDDLDYTRASSYPEALLRKAKAEGNPETDLKKLASQYGTLGWEGTTSYSNWRKGINKDVNNLLNASVASILAAPAILTSPISWTALAYGLGTTAAVEGFDYGVNAITGKNVTLHINDALGRNGDDVSNFYLDALWKAMAAGGLGAAASGVSRAASGVSRAASGVSRAASGVSRAASGVSRGAVLAEPITSTEIRPFNGTKQTTPVKTNSNSTVRNSNTAHPNVEEQVIHPNVEEQVIHPNVEEGPSPVAQPSPSSIKPHEVRHFDFNNFKWRRALHSPAIHSDNNSFARLNRAIKKGAYKLENPDDYWNITGFDRGNYQNVFYNPLANEFLYYKKGGRFK